MLSKNSNAVEKSPFLAPRRNKNLPGKNAVVAVEDVESKSSIAGCTFNLINAIIGAGILGMPYAMKQCTLAGGIFMIIAVVLITSTYYLQKGFDFCLIYEDGIFVGKILNKSKIDFLGFVHVFCVD